MYEIAIKEQYDYLPDYIREALFLSSVYFKTNYPELYEKVLEIKNDPDREVCRYKQHVTPIERRGNFNNGRKNKGVT